MANVQFNLESLKSYLKTNNIQISQEETEKINSIFDECDTINERGENIADGKLTNDEVPKFIKLVSEKLSGFSNHLNGFIDKLAGVKNSAENLQQVRCRRTEADLELYKKNADKAKEILLKNAESLGLSDEEVKYIKSIDYESIGKGAARYDKEADKIWLNTNDKNPTYNVFGFIKLIMHEVTHGVLRNTEYNNQQEIACEKRALEVTKKLYDNLSDKEKKENDFSIFGNETRFFRMSDMKDEDSINEYIDYWINQEYK